MTSPIRLGFEHTYADQLEGLYVAWAPPGYPAPEVVLFNEALRDELGLDPDVMAEHGAAILSGSLVPADARPLAQGYAGHQFGGFVPQLGDGRAVLLGELLDTRGRRRDLQLKGAGRTPFARGGDGRATLGPVLREVIVSEAMHHLGVPTTRMLAAVTTGEQVARQRVEPGAVVARVAASHLRIGTIQYVAASGRLDTLERLVAYAVARHVTEGDPGDRPALTLLNAVAQRQGALIARWMLVGFIHGVMNTDNMTLSGETIDYGPCAFMEGYDPATVFSSIDRNGRYAYGNQGVIGQWNIARLGEALLPLLAPAEAAAIARVEAAMARFVDTYRETFLAGMRAKLGLVDADQGDDPLVRDLLAWMQGTSQDFTLTFRRLADGLEVNDFPGFDGDFEPWRRRWQTRLGGAAPADVAARMNAANPLYIPRNHLVEEALDAAIVGDMAPTRALMGVLSSPTEAQPGRARYAEPAPSDFGPYRTFCGT